MLMELQYGNINLPQRFGLPSTVLNNFNFPSLRINICSFQYDRNYIISHYFLECISFFCTFKTYPFISFFPHPKKVLHFFFQIQISMIVLTFLQFSLQLSLILFKFFNPFFIILFDLLNLFFIIISFSMLAEHSFFDFSIHNTAIIANFRKTIFRFFECVLNFEDLVIIWRGRECFILDIDVFNVVCMVHSQQTEDFIIFLRLFGHLYSYFFTALASGSNFCLHKVHIECEKFLPLFPIFPSINTDYWCLLHNFQHLFLIFLQFLLKFIQINFISRFCEIFLLNHKSLSILLQQYNIQKNKNRFVQIFIFNQILPEIQSKSMKLMIHKQKEKFGIMIVSINH